MQIKVKDIRDVVIRFAGDSGDGMQLTGTLLSSAIAVSQKDLGTFPDFPAEIRAPQGTTEGVSGFQIHWGSGKINTPGDLADVLIAMNPASLRKSKEFIRAGATIIYDESTFDERTIKKAGYKTLDPIAEDNLQDYNLIPVAITKTTVDALSKEGVEPKNAERSKNMFVLGFIAHMYSLDQEFLVSKIKEKFAKKKVVADLNEKVFWTGYNYSLTMENVTPRYYVPTEHTEKGVFRMINGNTAAAWGAILAGEKSNLEVFLGTYPITPATSILEELSKHKNLGVKTFQAEDEIAAICSAIGASFAGNLALTSTSGPGLALKGEAIGLAVMAELPLVVANIQRGGPSTGLPTKTEQSDLMQALYGRNGESPCVVIAPTSPSDCFYTMFLACRIAIERMVPVIFLSDSFLSNGSEPFKIPDISKMPAIQPPYATSNGEEFASYKRDPITYARNWAIPGQEGLEHRIGGLEKNQMGTVNHSAANHSEMVYNRQKKIDAVVDYVPALEIQGNTEAEILLVGWGSTYGHLLTATTELNEEGGKVALAQFTHISPLPKNVAEVFSQYEKIVICELNLGQFANYLRGKYPQFQYEQYNKVEGLPFSSDEIKIMVKQHTS